LQQRAYWVQAAGWASVATAVVILVFKLLAWWWTGAASVLASLLDSGMDLISSGINLAALRYASRPADSGHRFGHGKAEALAAFVQALLLLSSAAAIVYYAAERARHGATAPAEPTAAIALMIAGMVLAGLLILFQRWVVRRTGSLLVAADSLHYRTDFFINFAVIATLLLASVSAWIDIAAAIGIALYIGGAAVGILRRAVSELLDAELPGEIDDRVLAIARQHPAVAGAHNLKSRRAGGRYFLQFDLDFPAGTTFRAAHIAAAAIREEIAASFAEAEVMIHFDPVDC
jgi:ferrous-iron efflux pump FieF